MSFQEFFNFMYAPAVLSLTLLTEKEYSGETSLHMSINSGQLTSRKALIAAPYRIVIAK